MADSHTDPTPFWESREAAWAEVRRIVADPNALVPFERLVAPIGSKQGIKAIVAAVRELRELQMVVRDLRRTITRLRRRVPRLVETAAYFQSAGFAAPVPEMFDGLADTLSRFADAFGPLERDVGEVHKRFSNMGTRALPSRLAGLVLVFAEVGTRAGHPALRKVTTPRSLAVLAIAIGHDRTCASAHEFEDVRVERWKQNRRRAYRELATARGGGALAKLLGGT
jgi:hypothetical protein